MLTEEQSNDLERVQKIAVKIILKNFKNNNTYRNNLNILELDTLKDRREILCLAFAKKCNKIDKMKKLFAQNISKHSMQKRNRKNKNRCRKYRKTEEITSYLYAEAPVQ